MTKEEFVSQLERGALQAAALPVTSAIASWSRICEMVSENLPA